MCKILISNASMHSPKPQDNHNQSFYLQLSCVTSNYAFKTLVSNFVKLVIFTSIISWLKKNRIFSILVSVFSIDFSIKPFEDQPRHIIVHPSMQCISLKLSLQDENSLTCDIHLSPESASLIDSSPFLCPKRDAFGMLRKFFCLRSTSCCAEMFQSFYISDSFKQTSYDVDRQT